MKTFGSLQGLRAVAAMAVVLFHIGTIAEVPKYWGDGRAFALFAFGGYGVHLFFVLSGFIIWWAHEDDIGRPGRFSAYVYKRVSRVYPAYWAALSIVFAATLLYPDFRPFDLTEQLVVQSFALAGTTDVSMLAVGWTLFHEMLFYATFAALLLDRRAGFCLLACWFAICLFVPGVGGYATNPINLLFPLGMAVAWCVRSAPVPAPGMLAAVGAAMFVVGTPGPMLSLSFYGLASAFLLAGCVELERSRALRVPSSLKLLGDASFSIYLVHAPILSIGAKLLTAGGTSLMVAVPILFAAGVTGGLVFYLAVERPLIRLMRAPRLASPRLRRVIRSTD